jgi:drug/metabolite transporter (DMT)-like permease
MLSIFLGFASAIGWGAADFVGGLASRKTGAYRTIFYAEAIGIFFVIAAALLFRQPFPNGSASLLALLAGVVGTSGLVLLYRSMTSGLMSIAAPVSALLSAIIPIVVGSFTEGLPKLVTVFGFGFALLAIWFISQSGDGVKDILAHILDLKFPILAGAGFGLYFVIMHAATRETALWPMVISRSGGMVIMAVYLFLRRDSWRVERSSWWLIALNGLLDVSGNLLYILASQTGRMDVAAILGSLFPASTVLLAALILKERVTRTQSFGIALALVSIILMTL